MKEQLFNFNLFAYENVALPHFQVFPRGSSTGGPGARAGGPAANHMTTKVGRRVKMGERLIKCFLTTAHHKDPRTAKCPPSSLKVPKKVSLHLPSSHLIFPFIGDESSVVSTELQETELQDSELQIQTEIQDGTRTKRTHRNLRIQTSITAPFVVLIITKMS